MGQIFGCTRVKQTKVAVRERFGKFDGVLQPGCHFVPWCFGYGVAGELYLNVQQSKFTYRVRTKDNVSVGVNIMIQYRPSQDKIEDAFYKLDDPEDEDQLIRTNVHSVVDDSMLKLDLATASEPEQKIQIRRDVQARLETVMSEYGYEVVETVVTYIWPDATVMKAMNEAAAAKIREGKTTEEDAAAKISEGKTTEEDAWTKV